MLRTRLLASLFTLVLLLWAVGGAGFLILKDAGRSFERRLALDYKAIGIAKDFRNMTSLLNTNYLSKLVGPIDNEPVDRGLYEQVFPGFERKIDTLQRLADSNERWMETTSHLEDAIRMYEEHYSKVLTKSYSNQDEAAELMQRTAAQTQRITDLSNGISTLAEERLFSSTSGLVSESRKNLLLISTFVILGTIIAVLIYFQLLRHLVEPVINLEESIGQVTEGNFELTLPSVERGSEFESLVTSFNRMASELRIRRQETDQRFMRQNLLNGAILAAIPSPVYIVADDANGIQLNPAAQALNEQMKNTNGLPLKARRLLDECIESKEDLEPEDPREALLFRVGSDERYYLPRIFHFRSELDEYSGWAIILYDVTRIRWLDDMKSNLLATVSHEIKTPLTGIRMVLLLLLENEANSLDDMQKTLLGSASEDCEKLLSTLNNLLDLSRKEHGAQALQLEPLDLAEAGLETVRLFTPAAEAATVNLVVDRPDGDLPKVSADPIRLREVIGNLVSNALKHSPENGTVTLRIQRHDSDYIRLSVIDDGAGVPEDIQDRVFERFFRAEGQITDGAGLGLFICREIMRAHEGRIGLKDHNPEHPTEFYIDVPIA